MISVNEDLSKNSIITSITLDQFRVMRAHTRDEFENW